MARTLELDTITEPSNSGTANITLSSNTTTTMPLVDINGGAIDATTLGAGTPSSVAATTLTTSGNATFGDAIGDATTVTGTLAVAGAATLNGNVSIGNAVGDTITVVGTTTINAVSGCNTVVGAANGDQTIDIASHDLANGGLKLAGVLVTASAAELNALDGITSTVGELNIMDGGTSATGTTLADGDRVVVNDGGTMKQVALTDFETYFETSLDTQPALTTVGALNAGSITSGFGNISIGSSTITTTGTLTCSTINTGQGANELYDMDQNVLTTSAVTFATVNTGQGNHELYEMNQDVTTTSNVTFNDITFDDINTSDAYGGFNNLRIKVVSNTYAQGFQIGVGLSDSVGGGSSAPLQYLSSGLYNHAFGYQALGNLRNGDYNTAFGWRALKTNQSQAFDGDHNTCFGANSMVSVTSASHCTSIGSVAAYNLTSGGNNTMIGYQAGQSASPSGAISSGSNVVVLGNNSVSALYCNDTSISSSDGRDKADVEDFTVGLDWIEAMRPVTYHWDKRSWYTEYDEETGEITSQSEPDGTHKKDKKNLGFIAQDVLAIEQAHGFASDKDDMLTVNLNEDDTAYGMKYERLVPVLVNAIKELSAKVKALEAA